MILFIITLILSYSPIFSFSNDYNYGTIAKKQKKDQIRFSIIKIPLGIIILHIISFPITDIRKIKILKILKFNEVQKNYTINELEIKSNSYKNHLHKLKYKKVEREIEFLKHKLSLELSIKSRQFNKIILFSTVTLALFPLLIKNYYYENLFYFTLFFVLIAAYLNMFLWIISYISVKNAIRSSFKDVKDSNGAISSIAESFYLDWLAIKREAQIEVGYCKNIQKIFIIIILLTGLYYYPALKNNRKSEKLIYIKSLGKSNLISKQNNVNIKIIEKK